MLMNPKKAMLVLIAISLLGLSPSVLAQTDKFDGRPAFAEGIDLSYYIWREGDKWLVRWTTKGPNRKFTGSVVAEGGELHVFRLADSGLEQQDQSRRAEGSCSLAG